MTEMKKITTSVYFNALLKQVELDSPGNHKVKVDKVCIRN